MSSWNFRLIRWACGTLALHEAYYDDDGKVTAVTLEPISFLAGGEDEADEAAAEEIRRELRHAADDATRLPILDCTEIPGCAGHRLEPFQGLPIQEEFTAAGLRDSPSSTDGGSAWPEPTAKIYGIAC